MPNPKIQTDLAKEMKLAMAELVSKLADQLSGRTFSPRVKLMSIDQVMQATQLGSTTIYQMLAAGTFPKPQRELGKNLWRESAIIAWLDANDPNIKRAG